MTLRAIFCKTENGGCNEAKFVTHYTVEFEAPELEAALRSGGYGPSSYEAHNLVGVEILVPKEPTHDN